MKVIVIGGGAAGMMAAVIAATTLLQYYHPESIIIYWQHNILCDKILVLQRDKTNVEEYIKRFNTNNFIIVKGFKPINISSTEIRNNLSKDYLDDKVYEYIRNNHLYEV